MEYGGRLRRCGVRRDLQIEPSPDRAAAVVGRSDPGRYPEDPVQGGASVGEVSGEPPLSGGERATGDLGG